MPMIRLIFFLFLLQVIEAPRAVDGQSEEGDIPRFSAVDRGLYRGGQPTEQGFQSLKKKGIKTIINLRAEDDSEAAVVQNLGMNYVYIPVPRVLPWSRIRPGVIAKFFELADNPANHPIFFHCQGGVDRTGALAAFYRIAVQRWDAERAYEEALNIGMRPFHAGLKWQIYNFHPKPDKLQPVMEPLTGYKPQSR